MMPLHVKQGTQRRWFQTENCQLAIDTLTCNDEIPALLDAVLLDEFNDLLHVVALILGDDKDWVPTAQDQAMPLTHSISLITDRAHSLALFVPDNRLATLIEVVKALGDVVQVEAHRQPVGISFDIPLLGETEQASVREPGSLLLLGDGAVESYAGKINVGSYQFSIPLTLDKPVLEALPGKAQRILIQSSINERKTTEVRLREHFEVDIRELIAGNRVSIPCNLFPGTRLDLILRGAADSYDTVSGIVVRLGQSLAFKADTAVSPIY